MIGKRSAQRSLYDVGNVFSYSPKAGSFYDQLALVAPELFRDEDFAEFYSVSQGRPSAPPSELALLTLMQFYANLSDEESVERSACDLRFATVLRRPAGERLCAKSTFQQFRAHLILHNKLGLIFERSISQARAAGMLPKELRVAIDTKPILGRGAVMDTLNLLASGVRQLGSALAEAEGIASGTFFAREGLADYLKPSIKGSQDLDWSNRDARNEFLSAIVADCTRLLNMAGARLAANRDGSDAQSFSDRRLRDAARLLEQLLLQDVDVVKTAEGGDKAVIRDGVTHGRVPSTTDPEQRHGRKSASKRFTGAKASVVTDTQSGIILETDVIPGDAPDATGALPLVEQAEENTGAKVVDTLGDCAYGSGETRQAFADAERELSVRVPDSVGRNGLYAKKHFDIDTETGRVTCPNNITTIKSHRAKDGGQIFSFGDACRDCPLRSECTTSKDGRTVHVHPQEALLQTAKEEQKRPGWRQHMRERLGVENSLARLGHLGIGQARYIGHEKTRFQLKISATVANLRRVWNWVAEEGRLAAA